MKIVDVVRTLLVRIVANSLSAVKKGSNKDVSSKMAPNKDS